MAPEAMAEAMALAAGPAACDKFVLPEDAEGLAPALEHRSNWSIACEKRDFLHQAS